jgi:hypothetical protein
MLVVLQDAQNRPVVRTAGPWQQLLARMRSGQLDRQLAGGTSPDATIGLALRAGTLEGMRERCQLASSVRHIIAAAAPDSCARLVVPLCRDRIRDSSAELTELIDSLLTPGPVSARGVALARALVTDAASPLYNRASHADLRATAHAVAAAVSAL